MYIFIRFCSFKKNVDTSIWFIQLFTREMLCLYKLWRLVCHQHIAIVSSELLTPKVLWKGRGAKVCPFISNPTEWIRYPSFSIWTDHWFIPIEAAMFEFELISVCSCIKTYFVFPNRTSVCVFVLARICQRQVSVPMSRQIRFLSLLTDQQVSVLNPASTFDPDTNCIEPECWWL